MDRRDCDFHLRCNHCPPFSTNARRNLPDGRGRNVSSLPRDPPDAALKLFSSQTPLEGEEKG